MKNNSHAYKGTATSKGARAQSKIIRGVRPISLDRLLLLLLRDKSKSPSALDHDRAEWLSVKQLAVHAGISERKLRALLREDLPHVKIGRLVRVSRSIFDDWMRSKTQQCTTAPVQLVRNRRRYLLEDREGLRDHTAHDHGVHYSFRRVT